MNELCYLSGKNALCFGSPLSRGVLPLDCVDVRYREEGKIFEEFINIGVSSTEPKLIERIGRRFAGIQPNGARLSLTKLGRQLW